MEYKQVIVIRQDLKLPKGKAASQAAHASVEAVMISLKNDRDKVREWRNSGQKKVVLKVADEKGLLRLLQSAKDAGLVCAMITDAGRTIVEPGTRTALAIGPDSEESIDLVTGNLQML